MSQELFDHRFAWRWLLPCVHERCVACVGFAPEELAWWRNALSPGEVLDSFDCAEGCLINLCGADLSKVVQQLAAAQPAWVFAVGEGRVARKFARALPQLSPISEYALLPPANPRVLVSLNSKAATLAGLRLHRPGRLHARLALHIASALAKIGFTRPLRSRVLLILARTKEPLPSLLMQGGLSADALAAHNIAMYLGHPKGSGRVVVLPTDEVPPRKIVKLVDMHGDRSAIAREAEALQAMSRTALADSVPAVLSLSEAPELIALSQDYRARTAPWPGRQSRAVVDFLSALANINRRERPLRDVLIQLNSETVTREFFATARGGHCHKWLERKAEAGAMICEHRDHGDFAPWNCAWTKRGLFVFDWETSRPQAVAFGDAFHYRVAPALHATRKLQPDKVLRQALDLASRIAQRQSHAADLAVHFVVWAAQRVSCDPLYMDMLNGVIDPASGNAPPLRAR